MDLVRCRVITAAPVYAANEKGPRKVRTFGGQGLGMTGFQPEVHIKCGPLVDSVTFPDATGSAGLGGQRDNSGRCR